MNGYGILGTIIAIIIGYLLGSINFSILIAKYFHKVDIQKVNTGNPGATNVTITLGKKWGLLVVFLDEIKTIIVMFITFGISCIAIPGTSFNLDQTSYYVPAVFTILGHCFPVYNRFKGGKGVACFLGFLLMINPFYFIICVGLWWIIYPLTKRVTFSSGLSILTIALVCWLPWISMITTVSGDYHVMMTSKVVWFNHFHQYNDIGYWDNFILINVCLDLAALLIGIVTYSKSKVKQKQMHNLSNIK